MADPNFNRLLLPKDTTWPAFPTGLASFGQSGKAQLRSGLQVGRRWTESYPIFQPSDPVAMAFLAQLDNLYANRIVFLIEHRHRRTLLGLGGGAPVVDSPASFTITSSANNNIDLTLSANHGWGVGDEVEITGHTRTPSIDGVWTLTAVPGPAIVRIPYIGQPYVSGGASSGTIKKRITGNSLPTRGWTPSRTVLKAGDVFKIAGITVVFDVVADAVSDAAGKATLQTNPPLRSGLSGKDGTALTINSAPGTVLFRAMIEEYTPPKAPANEWYAGLTVTFREVP